MSLPAEVLESITLGLTGMGFSRDQREAVIKLVRESMAREVITYLNIGLHPDMPVMNYKGGGGERLTFAEYSLMKKFLQAAQTYAVLPQKEIEASLVEANRAVSAVNIRAVIFGLRLKLEVMTAHDFTILSIYKQGYRLERTKA